jgi:hypothetical protein
MSLIMSVLGLTRHLLGGPFEYWLGRSHSLDVGNGDIIGQCVASLQTGALPPVLRKLSRAASTFPTWGEA